MNTKMAEVAPELASKYARYPMKRDRWLGLDEVDAEGKTIFAAGPKTEQVKKDYVWGQGPRGHGYYHLLNQHSYRNLHNRLRSQAPAQCCACTKAAREYYNDYSDVATIVYNRSVASRPDDGVGAKEAIQQSQVTAQGMYHADQNTQLVFGVAQAISNR